MTRYARLRSRPGTSLADCWASRLRCQRGFTLADSLVGCLLIMISVAGLHTVGMTALNGNLLARQNDQAAALAAQKIENIKQSGYDAATTGTTTESNLNAQGNTPGPFARTTAITAGPIANTKQLQVSVTWNNQAARTLTLTSLITSAG